MIHGRPCFTYPMTLTVAAVLFFCAVPASAVVIATGDGSGNTTAPEDDPGFANVGERGVGSAVYLGNRWVLTASHVRVGSVFFGGQEYLNVVDETYRLSNPAELQLSTELTDMLLIRLQEAPPLPSLHLPCKPIVLGSEVVMIGRGHDRAEEESFWDVRVVAGDNNDVWKELENSIGADKRGYRTKDSQSIRWGKNLVGRTKVEAESGNGDVLSFETSFTTSLPVDDLAQGIRGDSGGAVFRKNGLVWELAGMLHAISIDDNQPDGTLTAVFGNDTFSADLYAYREVLRELADFEPEVGDVDGDGAYTAFDIDQLHAAIRLDQKNCHFDFNEDGEVTEVDRDALLVAASTLLGDADLDGEVAFGDFLALSNAFTTEGGWQDGDFDGDKSVSFEDFLTLSRNFGAQFQPPPSVTEGLDLPVVLAFSPSSNALATAVPEPRSAKILALCLICSLSRLRRWSAQRWAVR